MTGPDTNRPEDQPTDATEDNGRNLPVTERDARRLRDVLDRKVSVQSVVNGTGRALATLGSSATRGPLEKLARLWKLEGNARSRGDKWVEAFRSAWRKEDRVYRRDGSVLLMGRNTRVMVANAGRDGVSLENADLSGGNWKLVPFTDTNLTGVDFRNASLKDNNFRDSTVRNALFQGAMLNCPKFHGVDLRGADFRRATIKGYSDGLDGFRNADLRGANFTGTTFTSCLNGYREVVSMRGANLDGAIFSLNANWSRIDLREAKNVDKAIIVDRRGKPIPGARLMRTGGVIVDNVPGADRRRPVPKMSM